MSPKRAYEQHSLTTPTGNNWPVRHSYTRYHHRAGDSTNFADTSRVKPRNTQIDYDYWQSSNTGTLKPRQIHNKAPRVRSSYLSKEFIQEEDPQLLRRHPRKRRNDDSSNDWSRSLNIYEINSQHNDTEGRNR